MFSFSEWELSDLNRASLTGLQVATLIVAYITLAFFGLRDFYKNRAPAKPTSDTRAAGTPVPADGPAAAVPGTIKAVPGEAWTYVPPAGHALGWLALAQGALQADRAVRAGDLAVLEHGDAPVTIVSTGTESAVFVLGSAMPHPYPLHLGSHSVHTTAEALAQGEARIGELYDAMTAVGDRLTGSGTVPVYR